MDSTDYILFVPMFFLAIYLWLESQDFGVAIVAPIVAQNEEERKTALNLLKPGLDGNEAWAFLCAGVTGALFSNGRFNIPESTFGDYSYGNDCAVSGSLLGEYIPAAFAIKRSPFYHNH